MESLEINVLLLANIQTNHNRNFFIDRYVSLDVLNIKLKQNFYQGTRRSK